MPFALASAMAEALGGALDDADALDDVEGGVAVALVEPPVLGVEGVEEELDDVLAGGAAVGLVGAEVLVAVFFPFLAVAGGVVD